MPPSDFEAHPDARLDDTPARLSRFHPSHRRLSVDETLLLDAIRNKAVEMEDLIEAVRRIRKTDDPAYFDCGRALALGVTNLEQAVMWTVKGLTA